MKVLVSSANPRAGKTALIYALSKLTTFSYEKRGAVRGAERLISGNGITIVEGRKTYKTGLAKSESDIDEGADKVVVIARYTDSVFDEIAMAARVFGDSFAATIVNCVKKLDKVKEVVYDLPFEVVGVVPYSFRLGAMSIEAIAKRLNGVILSKADVLIDDVLIGAMSPKCALPWLEKKKDAALVTGGDRVDLQKLALDIGVKCLILTGGMEPPKIFVKRAQEGGVAIILSEYDTLTSLEKIQKGVDEPLTSEKAEIAAELFKKYVDFKKLMKLLDLR